MTNLIETVAQALYSIAPESYAEEPSENLSFEQARKNSLEQGFEFYAESYARVAIATLAKGHDARFVFAAMRPAIAKAMAGNGTFNDAIAILAAALEKVRLDERERCAKIVEDMPAGHANYRLIFIAIAAAIRSGHD